MTARMRVAAVTGGRADYGLLSVPLRRLALDGRFDLRIIATGQHLAPAGAGTLHQILEDGLSVDEEVEILSHSDTALATVEATGRAVSGVGKALTRLKPDVALLAGDRYEILAAAVAAHLLCLPIAHIAGGDLTEGALDDALRHSITKLSHLHFVTNEDSERRVRQLGEQPSRIHLVGSPSLDRIGMTEVPSREKFFRAVGLKPQARNFLVTFHPVTAAADSAAQAEEMLAAFDALKPKPGLIFTGVNADTEGLTVEGLICRFCKAHPSATFRSALGASLYFGALTHCDAVIGNSSSGIYEAPSFKIPTVNIGTRQSGRLKAASVIDVEPKRDRILKAIERALSLDCSHVTNPYGDGRASERIRDILAAIDDPRTLLHKPFCSAPLSATLD